MFFHFATKALNKAGLERIGQIHIAFNPSYEKVVFHSLQIHRNGQSQNRLDSSRYNVLQRENELEDNIFNGSLTIVYFIDDVRVGDILEYSFSIIGSNPLFASHYSDFFYLQGKEPIEKRYLNALMHPDHSLNLRQFNTTLEPEVTDISPMLREYSIKINSTEHILDEQDLPSWYNPYPRIQISEYASWEEVIKTVLPLYTLPEDIKDYASSEMVELVNKWQESTQNPIQLATLALRFVQDEVRYLGFEEGLNSHKPTNPSIVFERRYGDCKDKCMLLCALLELMEIRSTPVLVHMSSGMRLPEVLPFPNPFNHVVLQVQIEESDYWVDPTISLQEGTLQTAYFPEYYWGLPLSLGARNLVPLPQLQGFRPTEIFSSFTFTSPNSVDLVVTRHFHGRNAEILRRRIDNKGIKKLSEDYANYYHKKYRGSLINTPLTVSDDRETNTIITRESYRIPTRVREGSYFLRIYSNIVEDYLDKEIHPDRKSPYALGYPLWVREKIHVENPFQQKNVGSREMNFDHESLHYSYSLRPGEKTLDLNIELKHHKDHISPDAVQEYWMILNEIEPYELLDISINPSEKIEH